MKKSIYKKSALVGLALLFSGASIAGTMQSPDVSAHCLLIANQLDQLAEANPNASCVENVSLSAIYLNFASKKA